MNMFTKIFAIAIAIAIGHRHERCRHLHCNG